MKTSVPKRRFFRICHVFDVMLCMYSFKVSTVERYKRFSECALPLATRVAKDVLQQVGAAPSAVGKMVFVTSTGATTGVSETRQ